MLQTGARAPQPLAEIAGVGTTPSRLQLDAAGGALYVANHRGGRVARIDLATDRVGASFEAGAPSVDAVAIGSRVYVPTLMPDRGLLAANEPARSPRVEAPPFVVTSNSESVLATISRSPAAPRFAGSSITSV